MSRLKQRKILSKLVFALLGLLVFLFSYQMGNRYALTDKQETSALVLSDPISLQPFSLLNEDSEPFDMGHFSTHWTLIMMGSHQQPSCRQLLTLYVLAWNRLAHNKSLQNMTRVAFLSSEAVEKSQNELKSFIEFIHPDFTALSGSTDNLHKLSTQIGISEADTTIRQCNPQSSVVTLINPQGQLTAFFTGITDPAIIAHDLEVISNKYNESTN